MNNTNADELNYGKVDSVNIIEELIGKVFSKVENIGELELAFIEENGNKYIFYHERDCCEDVWIEDISGELNDLISSPITMAEEVCHECIEAKDYGTETYTFYKFATIKGYVTVRWCGSSDEYYSEAVSFCKIINPDNQS